MTFDAQDPAPSSNQAADAPPPQTGPGPGRPGSLPFTPYGGTTAPYRPKGGPSEARDAKGLTCDQCKAGGFLTRADLDAHRRASHAAPAGAAPEKDATGGSTPR